METLERRSVGTSPTNGLVGLVATPIQAAANERGHGRETAAAGVGGLIGAMLGSFFGPVGALVFGGLGAAIGYSTASDS